MQNFKITFGTGKDKVTVTTSGTDVLNALELLNAAGWDLIDVKKIERLK